MVRSLPNRLAMALLQLADSEASEGNPKVAVTQNDLASIIGMSRESTNKQLSGWAANNLVRLKRGGIVITCVDALISIAEGDKMVTRSLRVRASSGPKSSGAPLPIGLNCWRRKCSRRCAGQHQMAAIKVADETATRRAGKAVKMSVVGQNEPFHSLVRHGRSTSVSGPAGPAVGASESGHGRNDWHDLE